MFLFLWGGSYKDNLVRYQNNMFAYESLHHSRTFHCNNSNLTSCLPYNNLPDPCSILRMVGRLKTEKKTQLLQAPVTKK